MLHCIHINITYLVVMYDDDVCLLFVAFVKQSKDRCIDLPNKFIMIEL